MSKEQPELQFYSEIDDDAVEYTSRMLNAAGGQPITFCISSPGGFAFPGAAVFNLLAAYPGKKTARIDGIAVGTAALLVQAADRRVTPGSAYLLVDEPSGLVIGPATQHREMAADLDRIAGVNAGIYAKRSGRSIDACRVMMQRGALMTAAEAKSVGLIDEVAPGAALVAAFDLGLLPLAAGPFCMRVDPTGAARQGLDPSIMSDWKAANMRAKRSMGGAG
jgi:ATP-dependent protease ClpP protease subunit